MAESTKPEAATLSGTAESRYGTILPKAHPTQSGYGVLNTGGDHTGEGVRHLGHEQEGLQGAGKYGSVAPNTPPGDAGFGTSGPGGYPETGQVGKGNPTTRI